MYSEDDTGEYGSVKYQWNNWGTFGVIALPSRKKLLYLKKYKNEVLHLLLSLFNFWPATEKCYYVSISTGCQNNSLRIIFFFHLGFLSRTFTIHTAPGEGGDIYLTPLSHFHSLHIHWDISRVSTAESSLLLIVSTLAVLKQGTFGFRAQVDNH